MALSKRKAARERSLANLKNAPPAPPGNARALRHGGYAAVSAAERDGELRRIRDALAEDAPLLDRADAVMLELLADAIVHWRRVRAHIADHGWRDKDGPKPEVDLSQRLRREIADYLDEMGMSPRARVKLGLDLRRGNLDAATALSAAREEPNAAIRAGILRAAGLEVEEGTAGDA
jgi:Phage terminase, small subunit